VIRVLVVDDDFRGAPVHREFTKRCEGFGVAGVALSGAEALRLNGELQPDLVLLDLYLPDIHGLEVARRLRHDREVDILVITAARDVSSVRAAMYQGVIHYLIKPFTLATFRDRLASYAAVHRELASRRVVNQPAVDGLFGLLRVEPMRRLPKGISQDTLRLVEQILVEAGCPMTADEIGHIAGVSRVTARRYLQALVDAGVARLDRQFGSPGRPRHRYVSASATPDGPDRSV
jgi:response regulator of citrate/malate metabolism